MTRTLKLTRKTPITPDARARIGKRANYPTNADLVESDVHSVVMTPTLRADSRYAFTFYVYAEVWGSSSAVRHSIKGRGFLT